MPEGVEIEYYRRAAERACGRVIERVDANDAWFLKRETSQEALDEVLVGESFTSARRIGKLLLMDVSSGAVIGLRFGMTGRIVVDGVGPIEYLEYASAKNDPAWNRFSVYFGDGGSLVIHDPRRLGGVELDPDESKLGVDAFAITLKPFQARVAVGAVPIKARLLDQHRLAGVGNLIADETLWRAGIDPGRHGEDLDPNEVTKLHRWLRRVLAEFLANGGSHTGQLQSSRVRGGACPRCATVLDRREIGGRTTFSCPHHQR